MATGWVFCRTSGGTKNKKSFQGMGQSMKKTIAMMAVLAALAGCNTVAGVGQDISGGANRVAGWLGG